MKKIFILIIPLLTLTSLCYADVDKGDCDLYNSKDDILKSWESSNENYSGFVKAMPKKALEKAFDNLNKYCSNDDKSTYPESPYIFDHILDVYLRRLDAKQNNENGKDLIYGLGGDVLDPLGKDWREFITEHGNNIEGSLPLEIKEKYESTRKGSKNVLGFTQYSDDTITEWKGGIESAVTSYDSWTLYDKYNLACDISTYINENVMKEATKLETKEYEGCKELTKNRINNENKYMKAILMQKANVLLTSSINAYINTYLVGNKLDELQKIINNMNSSLFEINKAIETLTPKCS